MSAATADNAEAEFSPRHRPLTSVLCGFALGIAAEEVFAPPLWFWLALGAAAGVAVACALRCSVRPWGRWVLGVLLLLAVGGAYQQFRFVNKSPRHLKNLRLPARAIYNLRGRVQGLPRFHLMRQKYLLAEEAGRGLWLVRVDLEALSGRGGSWSRVEGGVSVFVPQRPPLAPGDLVQWVGSLHKERPPTNPGQRDQRRAYRRMGSYGTSSVESPRAFEVLEKAHWYARPLSSLKALLMRRLLWEAERPVSGLTAALLFGERGWLHPEQKDMLTECGVYHLLAISGLHVGMFAGLCWLVLIWLRIRVRPRMLILIGLVWLYVVFTGVHVSAVRAGLMLTIMLAAPLLWRRSDHVSALMGAAFVILLVRPQDLFQAGFQLTFVAVWAIVYLYRELARLLWPWEGFLSRAQRPEERSLWSDLSFYGKHYLLLSFCVWVAVVPLTLYHFRVISFLTPVLTAALYPLLLLLLLSSYVVGLGALVSFPWLHLPLYLTQMIGQGMENLLRASHSLKGFIVYTSGPPWWWIGLFYLMLVLWVVRARLHKGHRAFVVAALVLSLSYMWADFARSSNDRFKMVVADVGAGQAVVLRLPSGSTILYDAGSFRTGAVEAVSDLLWHEGIHRIDTIVISHINFDHYSFLPLLLRRFEVDRVAVPAAGQMTPRHEALREMVVRRGVRLVTLSEGAKLSGGSFQCEVLHPNPMFIQNRKLDQNNKSVVMLCRFGRFRFLLPGDVEEPAMRRLAEDYGPALDVDLILLPHHGSYNEVTERFIKRVSPKVAVASCGKGQIEDGTVEALAEEGIAFWTTARDGAVTARYDPYDGALQIEGYISGDSSEVRLRRPVPESGSVRRGGK